MVYYDSFVLKDYAHDRSHYGVIEYRRYDVGHYDEIKVNISHGGTINTNQN